MIYYILYIILYYIILHYIILYYIYYILYIILYYITLYYIILYYICIQSEHLGNESFQGFAMLRHASPCLAMLGHASPCFAMLRPGPQCALQGVDVSLQSLESAWIANGVLRDKS